jgi:hypothetical protein
MICKGGNHNLWRWHFSLPTFDECLPRTHTQYWDRNGQLFILCIDKAKKWIVSSFIYELTILCFHLGNSKTDNWISVSETSPTSIFRKDIWSKPEPKQMWS